MTTAHVAELARGLRALRVIDAGAVAVRNRTYSCASILAGAAFGRPHDQPLVIALTQLIYSELYVRRRPSPSTSDRGFVAALSTANKSATGWDAGWTVVAREGDVTVVEKDQLRLYARASEVFGDICVGARVHVRVGKENRAVSPGYYFFFSEAVDDRDPPALRSVRIYMNLDVTGATAFVDALTSRMNGARIPFRAKVAASPAGFSRADAAVIYLDPERYSQSRAILSGIRAGLGRRVHAATPLFTKRVAPGVGVAEEPGTGDSFGEHRSRALAIAVARAHEHGMRSASERLACAVHVFREEGIDPERPHLTLGHEDGYDAWT